MTPPTPARRPRLRHAGPWAALHGAALALALASLRCGSEQPEGGASPPSEADAGPSQPAPRQWEGCDVFPVRHVLNTTVVGAPVHPDSARWLAHTREVAGPHPRPGASASVWEGSRSGIPVNFGGVPRVLALDGSYGQPASSFTAILPATPRLEGEPNPAGAWDRHALVFIADGCQLGEHINYRRDLLRDWLTGASVLWSLTGYQRAQPYVEGGGAAEAAKLPIAPLVYRYDEVASGALAHPLRFAAEAIAKGRFLWPAGRTDGRDEHPDALPMGARLRLRPDADLSALGPQARVIAEALQVWGAFLADSVPDGGRWGFTGEGDPRWDDADLRSLSTLDLADFDVVDQRAWQVAEDSLEARLPR